MREEGRDMRDDTFDQIMADSRLDAEDYCEKRDIAVPFHTRHDEALVATERAMRADLIRRARDEADASFVARNIEVGPLCEGKPAEGRHGHGGH